MRYVKSRQNPHTSMVFRYTFGVNERMIICTCDDIKGVNDHEFICTTGINELRYKLFDHILCGISISIGLTSFTVLNDNKNNLLCVVRKDGREH